MRRRLPLGAERVSDARVTQRRLAHRAIVKVVAAFSLLVFAIVSLGFGWATCAIELAVVFCVVLIDRTGSMLVDRWRRGAAGEELVGETLNGLREHGWFAPHDVQLDHGNIDHVLVGPAGMFTIETKSHRGRLRAGAIDARMLKQAYAQAKSLERITGLRAVPLLGTTHRSGELICVTIGMARPERARASWQLVRSLPTRRDWVRGQSTPGVESLVPARATVRVGSKAEPRSDSKAL